MKHLKISNENWKRVKLIRLKRGLKHNNAVIEELLAKFSLEEKEPVSVQLPKVEVSTTQLPEFPLEDKNDERVRRFCEIAMEVGRSYTALELCYTVVAGVSLRGLGLYPPNVASSLDRTIALKQTRITRTPDGKYTIGPNERTQS